MPAPTESNPEVQLADVIDIARVRHAIRMLTADHQEILILRFGQRLSLQECADMTGKSVSAIKSLQFRALDTLRSILVTEGANGRL
jgi:RNA polymerase sigma-70 factor (ECF subfamily)